MEKNLKKIIGRFLNGRLDINEDRMLLQDERVERRMHTQWEHVDEHINAEIGQRIWNRIEKDNRRSYSKNHSLRIYKFIAVAATFLLVLSVGTLLYVSHSREKEYINVVSTGIKSIQTLKLPDGTVVNIGPNSILSYPKEFAKDFRDVKLKGQAFFKVAKDAERHFTVHTNKMNVTALGTAFEVSNYEKGNIIETVLLEGKVKINLNMENGQKEILLNPNEMIAYDKNLKKVNVATVDANQSSEWRSGTISFKHENIGKIVTRIQNWFGRDIYCPESIAEKYHFTFSIYDESLEQILSLLSSTSDIGYVKTGNRYVLYEK